MDDSVPKTSVYVTKIFINFFLMNQMQYIKVIIILWADAKLILKIYDKDLFDVNPLNSLI